MASKYEKAVKGDKGMKNESVGNGGDGTAESETASPVEKQNGKEATRAF